MQDEHRRAIQSNFTSLVETTDLDSMVTALYEKGVFSERMIEPYQDLSVPARDRKRKMYSDITRRGPKAFDRLLEVLSEAGYWNLVRDLDPDSSLHMHSFASSQLAERDENNFVSLRGRHKAKTDNEVQKNGPGPAPQLPPASALPLNNNHQPFIVKKSTKFFEEDPRKDNLQLYRMRGRHRGVLLVFSYISFKDNIETFRNGIDVDCDNLKYLFSEFGFKVSSYKNLDKQETIRTLESLKDAEVLNDAESVFIVVSSHGHERTNTSDIDIRCSNGGLISLYDIIEFFNNRNLPALFGIPKVFIFQLCRGSKFDYLCTPSPPHLQMPRDTAVDGTTAPTAPPTAPPAAAVAARAHAPHRPLYSDILIANSTLPGFVSHRDNTKGSWYIQTLCEVFAERAHKCDVDSLFSRVDEQLQKKFKNKQTSSVERWSFNKLLYLHPGLYE